MLTALIDSALQENRDLVIAAARVDAFLGKLVTTRSAFYPQISYSRRREPQPHQRRRRVAAAAGRRSLLHLYSAALGATWQIDLFGRVRRQTEAAQAQVYATEQGRRGVVLSVVTSVATSYIGLRALDRQLEISRQTAKNYLDTQRIFELRHKGGVVSKLEVAQVESQYQQALRRDPAARAADRGAGEPDRGAAGAQSVSDPARQVDRAAADSRDARRPSVHACWSGGRTSCRPSRT